MTSVAQNSESRPSWRRWAGHVLRWTIATMVLAGVGRRIWLERERLADYRRRPDFVWLAVGGGTYLAGLSTCAVFWWMAMRDRGVRPSWPTTLTAYFAGHLGKYVPGKALVLVIRAGMMRDSGVGVAIGAITCAHETLLMMATGAVVALAIEPAIDVPHRGYLMAVSAALAASLGVFALPPVASRLGRWATNPFLKSVATDEVHASRWSTLLFGALLIAGGWLLMGLSLAAVLAAMQELGGLLDHYGTVPTVGLLTVVVALATVGGFVSLLPGGLGSREWIVLETLAPVLGADKAVAAAVAAILLRVVWIVAEVSATAVWWIVDRQCKKRRTATN